MDKEQLENLTEKSSVRPAESTTKSPDSGLPGQIGNRAFTSLIQRSTKTQGAGPLDPEIADDIKGAKGGGRPLDDDTRADMEGHLGADLSGVRVHTGGEADNLNRSVQAEAFTTGNDVFFKSGKYAPDSSEGRGLLAHELTHVVQQRSGQAGTGESRVSSPNDSHEVEAKSVGDAVAASSPATAPAPAVARQEADDVEPREEQVARSVDREDLEEEEGREEMAVDASVDRSQEEEVEEMPQE
jgi:hypothetical protein